MRNFTAVHFGWIGVTAVQFYVIDSPIGKSLRISIQMIQNSRITTASEISIIFINTKIKAFGMYLNQ